VPKMHYIEYISTFMTSFTHQSVCRDDPSVVSFSDFGKMSTRGMKEEVRTPANDTV